MADAARVAQVRRFNRFYTRRIGVLREGLLASPYPLPETRVLYELGRDRAWTAAELGRELDLDPGQLSRLLRRLEGRGLVARERDSGDGRRSRLGLTPAGLDAFATLDARSAAEIAGLLAPLTEAAQLRLLGAMAAIGELWGGGVDGAAGAAARPEEARVLLRGHRPGDMGWVVQRHAELYAAEHGWDGSFEALVARVAADFIERFDPALERAWIAERGGARLGSALLVRGGAEREGRLRLLLVEPAARGEGLGRRLVEACVGFARERGYRRVTLWTNDVLRPARRLYEAAGFELARAEPHRSFGRDLVGETWELDLGRAG